MPASGPATRLRQRSGPWPGPEQHGDTEGGQQLVAGEAEQHGPPGAVLPRLAVVAEVEGRLYLVGQQQLLRRVGVLLGHPDRHVAERIRPVEVAQELGRYSVGAQPGRDYPRVKGSIHGPKVHHVGPGHHQPR